MHVQRGAVTGNESVLPVIEAVLELPVKGKEQVPERPVLQLLQLLIEGCLRGGASDTLKKLVDFLPDAFPFHSKVHEGEPFEPKLPVAGEVLAKLIGICLRIRGKPVNCGKQDCLYRIRIYYSMIPPWIKIIYTHNNPRAASNIL